MFELLAHLYASRVCRTALWEPWVMWLHVVSDALIVASYVTIPFTLVYFLRKRRDLPFGWMFACFAAFIIACGATHAMSVWTLWVPTYWLDGAIKAVCAAASVPTAVLLIRLVPKALKLPSPDELRRALAHAQKNKEQYRMLLDAKAALLAETNHRIKNSLQMVTSILNMQSRQAVEETRHALRECQARIRAIALVHDSLSSDGGNAQFSEYAETLVGNLFQATAPPGVKLELDVKGVTLPLDRAIPCGLILNELVTNALKYAFPDGRTGTLRVAVATVPRFLLSVADDGVGMAPGPPKGLGLRLVSTFAEQLGTRLEVDNRPGKGVSFSVVES